MWPPEVDYGSPLPPVTPAFLQMMASYGWAQKCSWEGACSSCSACAALQPQAPPKQQQGPPDMPRAHQRSLAALHEASPVASGTSPLQQTLPVASSRKASLALLEGLPHPWKLPHR